MGPTTNDRWVTSSPRDSSYYKESDTGFQDHTSSLPHPSRDQPCTSSSSATLPSGVGLGPSTSSNNSGKDRTSSVCSRQDYKTQSLPNPKFGSSYDRPGSYAEDCFSSRTPRKKKTESFSASDHKNAYDSSSLSSCGSNQSRNSDYSFLGGKDEYVTEKKSTTTILATSAKYSEPPADMKNNVQGYERTEGKTIVKTVRTLSVKKFDRPPWFLDSKATTP